MKLFCKNKKRYFRYVYNNSGNFFVAEWIKEDGTFGKDFLRSGKPLGLLGEKLIQEIKRININYEWTNI